jgi:hypothetical protein
VARSIVWTPAGGGEAVAEHEGMVLDAHGVVIPYGAFYAPGTHSGNDEMPAPPRIHIRRSSPHCTSISPVALSDLSCAESEHVPA